jgi:hypothetical protein
MKENQTPPEVEEAVARVIADANGWRDEQGVNACVPVARAAIAAAINAWPGAYTANQVQAERPPVLCLPFPQEARDE